MSDHQTEFWIEATYLTFPSDPDDADLTEQDLASRLRGWGFTEVSVEKVTR